MKNPQVETTAVESVKLSYQTPVLEKREHLIQVIEAPLIVSGVS